LDKKIFGQNFFGRKSFGRNFYCCKIISSETVWMRKFMVENFFIAAKSFPRKEFGRVNLWSKFLLLQNHNPGNSLDEKTFD